MRLGPSRLKKMWDNIDWIPALFLTILPIAAVLLSLLYFYLEGWSWTLFAMFVFFYAATAMSITAGYHRLFSHRTHEASFFVRLMYALFGAAALQNSILKWSVDHRLHHRYEDKEDDPYSINKGFWYAHIGWMVTKQPVHPMSQAYARDLIADPIVVWQDKHYMKIAILMGFILPMLLGLVLADSALGGLAIPGMLRMVTLHHGTFFINSWCHYFGRQPYTDSNTARDSWLMAFATFGEGFHNFHHKWSGDYRNGVRWYQWDPTKWLIGVQRAMGLVYNLKRTPDSEILNARMDMMLKKVRENSAHWNAEMYQKLEVLREHVKAKQEHWRQSRERYAALGRAYRKTQYDKFLELRRELHQARREFAEAFQQWQEQVSLAQRAYARISI